MRANLTSDAPTYEHFIDLENLLAGICQTGVSTEELQNKEVHTEKVKRLENQSVVATLFQRTYSEDWALYNENNHFSKMTTFEQ